MVSLPKHMIAHILVMFLVPIGLTYATKVTSEKSIQFVPHTPHALFSTPEGRDAIKKAIDDGTKGAQRKAN